LPRARRPPLCGRKNAARRFRKATFMNLEYRNVAFLNPPVRADAREPV
jgi:hypothetical protein